MIIFWQVAFFSMGVCTMLMTVAPLVVGYQYQVPVPPVPLSGIFFLCSISIRCTGPILLSCANFCVIISNIQTFNLVYCFIILVPFYPRHCWWSAALWASLMVVSSHCLVPPLLLKTVLKTWQWWLVVQNMNTGISGWIFQGRLHSTCVGQEGLARQSVFPLKLNFCHFLAKFNLDLSRLPSGIVFSPDDSRPPHRRAHLWQSKFSHT